MGDKEASKLRHAELILAKDQGLLLQINTMIKLFDYICFFLQYCSMPFSLRLRILGLYNQNRILSTLSSTISNVATHTMVHLCNVGIFGILAHGIRVRPETCHARRMLFCLTCLTTPKRWMLEKFFQADGLIRCVSIINNKLYCLRGLTAVFFLNTVASCSKRGHNEQQNNNQQAIKAILALINFSIKYRSVYKQNNDIKVVKHDNMEEAADHIFEQIKNLEGFSFLNSHNTKTAFKVLYQQYINFLFGEDNRNFIDQKLNKDPKQLYNEDTKFIAQLRAFVKNNMIDKRNDSAQKLLKHMTDIKFGEHYEKFPQLVACVLQELSALNNYSNKVSILKQKYSELYKLPNIFGLNLTSVSKELDEEMLKNRSCYPGFHKIYNDVALIKYIYFTEKIEDMARRVLEISNSMQEKQYYSFVDFMKDQFNFAALVSPKDRAWCVVEVINLSHAINILFYNIDQNQNQFGTDELDSAMKNFSERLLSVMHIINPDTPQSNLKEAFVLPYLAEGVAL